VYTGLGDTQKALDWLERAYDERGILVAWLKTWPLYDPLRNEPRFKELLARMKYPN
jgi:serine/threonine-protein kinase